MGVIGNQPVRKDYVWDIPEDLSANLKDMIKIANENKVSLSDVIALRQCMVKEAEVKTVRMDGDYRDEHAGGYHDAMRDIAQSIQSISDAIQGE